MLYKDINIKELFKLMQEYDIAETSLQDGKVAVTIKRKKEPIIMNPGSFPGRALENIPVRETPEVTTNPETPAKADKGEGKISVPTAPAGGTPGDHYHKILAPLVGTFYRSPAPDAASFVEVGDQVNKGDVLCIIEAMKSMNEIPSDVKGIVKEICIENAQMVEFEQVLFKIDTSKS